MPFTSGARGGARGGAGSFDGGGGAVGVSPDSLTTHQGGPKCATVTMMLAERMARSDWSVDDEHFFETNTMNVWQTLEYLSGVNLRKRYHYEGYNDTENVISTLTPSWRRDSFVEKNTNQKEESSAAKLPVERDGTGGGAANDVRAGSGNRRAGGGGSALERRTTVQEYRANGGLGRADAGYDRAGSAVSNRSQRNEKKIRKRRVKKKIDTVELDPEYALSPTEYTDLIKCTFNLPRISACLERLMGTNVVRLTDRKFMNELRERIEADYRIMLEKRIQARELKEVERERILIIEGKSDIIPAELANDPIFVVNKDADLEIRKERSKLKTNRERNAERLKLQGLKWERERLQHQEAERERLEELREQQKEQVELEQQYHEEDAERGMDLLRIDNEDWRACEQKLKEFLETERTRMKERSMRVATPYTTDPNDVQNIVRARQKFRETEQRIRNELEEKFKNDKDYTTKKDFKVKSAASTLSKILASESFGDAEPGKQIEEVKVSKDLLSENGERMTKKYSDDTSDMSSERDIAEQGSTISESKLRHAKELQEEIEDDVHRGLLISRQQFEHLRYQDGKILQLRHATDVLELYTLAEEIIIGDRYEEEIAEEEMGEEEGQPTQDEDDDKDV